jgi:ribosomal protein L16/L10AE
MSESSLQQCKIGLRAVESGLITAIQLDVCRIILKRAGSQRAKIFILPSVDRSITKKTVGTRIGKGKGDFSY